MRTSRFLHTHFHGALNLADFLRGTTRAVWVLLTVAIIGATLACGSEEAPGSSPRQGADGTATSPAISTEPALPIRPPEVISSPIERISTIVVPEADRGALVDGNTKFALDLYKLLSGADSGNIFYSPYSISLALAMAYAGANGDTETQMANALGFALEESALHSAFNGLDLELAGRGSGLEEDQGTRFQLSIANALWGQQGFELEDEFLDTLARNYGAGVRLVDFARAAEEARVTINEWVGDQTEDRIKELIPPGAIDVLTRLVLTNAIYFNASWAEQFNEESTADLPFFRLDGSSSFVSTMRQSIRTGYSTGDGYQAVELQYAGGEISMLVILPDSDRFAEIEGRLDSELLQEAIDNQDITDVTLSFPKFEFESEFSLVEALTELGMPDAFNPPPGPGTADFSGIDGKQDLYISSVLHKAFVAVDEQGTEAAAATAVLFRLVRTYPTAQMDVNRPFIFLIRDRESGTVLFLGRVLDPGD